MSIVDVARIPTCLGSLVHMDCNQPAVEVATDLSWLREVSRPAVVAGLGRAIY
jgi:hypothetical protein